MTPGGRKRRRKFCFPSCFSASSVWDHDELEFPQDGLPLSYVSLIRSRSRTVPVVDFAGDGGEGRVEVLGEMQCEDAQALLSPAGNQDRGLVQKFRREEKKAKSTVQPLTHTPLSSRAHKQQSMFCHVSTKFNSGSQALTPLHRARAPVQSRTSHPVPAQPNRSTSPAPSPTRSARRPDAVTGLLMVSASLTVMLFCGRLCAVLCNCALFYLLSFIPPPPPAVAAATTTAKENDGAEEVDLDSPAYKKKVVLMGLLERNRKSMSPMDSPAKGRVREQPW